VLATPASLPAIKKLDLDLASLGPEGYVVRATKLSGHAVTLVAANSDVGLLYGSFALLTAMRAGVDLAKIDQRSAPKVALRMLNHWTTSTAPSSAATRASPSGSGTTSRTRRTALRRLRSRQRLDWHQRHGVNNVNARAEMMTAPGSPSAALADVLRPYGIRVYLSVRWSAPMELKQTATADPLDPAVRKWWKDKAAEIYKAIPIRRLP
jgi:alpha-glucuronidase